MASLSDLITAWNTGPEEHLTSFYGSVLDGDPFVATPEDTDLPPQLKTAATDMAAVLNGLKATFEKVRFEEEGFFGSTYSLSEDNALWPRLQNPDLTEAANVLLLIVEDLKVLQENPLYSQPYLYNDAFALGEDRLENLGVLTEAVLDSVSGYFELFPGISVSLKADAPPIPNTQGLGPTPIFSDSNLEASLVFNTNQTHYIGLRLNAEKSNGARSASYLPVRLAPNTSEETLPLGWSDPNYSLINYNGFLAKPKNKDSDGIEVPLGLEIKVVEIVPSKTGIWVGFVSTDSRLGDMPKLLLGDQVLDRWDKITRGQKRILYTKAQYVRIKENAVSSNPDPYLSERAMFGDDKAAEVKGIQGSDPVNPKENQNWITLRPNDVRLNYYSFNEHNLKIIAQGEAEELLYNENTIKDFPTLKYSEGYFYFILGEQPRKTEAELINESSEDLENSPSALEAAKSSAGAGTAASIKQEAWDNLLNYLGKNIQGGNSKLYKKLYDEYFVEVTTKLNTNTVNPNNQKILYAIRASYVDSLPESTRLYTGDFSPDSPYLSGNDYAVSLPMKDIKKRCWGEPGSTEPSLVKILTGIKSKMESSKKTVENSNGSEFSMETLITLVEALPSILGGFFNRQAFPSSMNKSFMHDLVLEGVNTSDEQHLVQIGVKDNAEVGGNVRETISYVLFSPSPDSFQFSPDPDFQNNLYYLDPYLTAEELSGQTDLKRSGIPLRTAMPWLRGEVEGIYASRALHLFLAYDKIKGQTDLQKDWPKFMSSYMVPPVRIYHSKDPSLIDPEELDCDEIIKKLNKSGPNTGLEERQLMNKLYNSSECADKYFNQFKASTPAVSPGMSKQALEKKAEQADGKGGSIMDNQYVRTLYTGFFNTLDMRSMMGLIMACLEHQLGIPMTAEAICEAGILHIIKEKGPGPVENLMLMNALLSPNSEASKKFIEEYWEEEHGDVPPFAPDDFGKESAGAEVPGVGPESLNVSYNDAPIASSMLMAKTAPSSVIEVVKNLEKSGVHIDLIPGERKVIGSITVPGSSLFQGPVLVSEEYAQTEIENEKQRLKEKGYSEFQAKAAMVGSGYFSVDPKQYEPLLGSDDFSSPGSKLAQTLRSGVLSGHADPSFAEDLRADGVQAERWLAQMKSIVGLTGLCELIIGQVLDGLQDLIKDPGAFFDGGATNWWEDFLNSLKRQFSFKVPTMKFPDNLMTDNHMGDYGEKLLQTLLSMIAQMLGQIVRLLLVNALEQCLEENSDVGVLGRPSPVGPDIPFPTLERANLPRFDNIPAPDVVAWMKDILDHLKTSQLCALLRGDATKQTLHNCLARTREHWPNVYSSGIDTIYDIRIAFEKIGRDLDLDICDVLESPALTDNLCEAVFDKDARCQELMNKGLTEKECQEQIDREIDDLRSKVAGLASLSMLDINPLSMAFPPICGEGGSFVIPPGVRDTMDRITDNMLTNVKGSLLVDMAGLKFFSTPPRALLALSDPQELNKAHEMFIDMAKNPYRKECLVLIGDPQHHLQKPAIINGTNYGHYHELYPVTYNKYIHYGNFSTWNIKGEDFTLEAEEDFTLDVSLDDREEFIRSKEDLKADIQDYWGAAVTVGIKLRHSNNAEVFFNRKDLKPMHVGLLNESSIDGLNIDSDAKTALTAWHKDFALLPNHVEKRIEVMEEELESEIQSSILGTLIVNAKDALGSLSAGEAYFPGNIKDDNIGTTPDVYTTKKTAFGATLKKVYSLDTKLKDIYPDPNRWYVMLRHYTGVDISPYIFKGTAGHGGSQRFLPEKWLKGAYVEGQDLIGSSVFNEDNPKDFVEKFYTSVEGAAEELKALYHSLVQTEATEAKFKKLADDKNAEGVAWFDAFLELQGMEHAVTGQELAQEYFFDEANVFTVTVNWAANLVAELEDEIAALKKEKEPLSPDNIHWFNWIKISPGLRNLVRIAVERQRKGEDVMYGVPGITPSLNDILDGLRDGQGNHNLAFAFMELTVAEATGLEYSRLKKIFPNISDPFSISPGIVFGLDKEIETAVVKKVSSDFVGPQPNEDEVESTGLIINRWDVLGGTTKAGEEGNISDYRSCFYPQFLVFERPFRDPNSPLSSKDPDIFSLNKEKVNQELYDFFNFIPPAMFDQSYYTIGDMAYDITQETNFNSDVIKYDLPFTEITSKSAPGIDGQGKITEIMNVFRTDDAGEQLKELADSLEVSQIPRSLINQNIATPLNENITKQNEVIKNVSKLMKASPLASSDLALGQFIKQDSYLKKEIYNFDFFEGLDPKVQQLINTIYSGPGITSIFEETKKTLMTSIPTGPDTAVEIFTAAPALETLNLKSQIFGQLLTKKFIEKFDEFYDGAPLDNKDKFENALKHRLTTHAYPALQYAYSTQMFAKLKQSRLHERGFMKKLWKKILKSPLNSDNVDPRCQQVFDQIGAPSVQDLDKTETDFFNLGEVKTKIIEFYKKSLCQDVYEAKQQGMNSTRISLMEGMIKLVIKIYTLEMCLASVIAWDSFDFADAMKDSSFISIIIQNITDDFNLEFISFYATDILRKEENLTDIQLAEFRQRREGIQLSSIEFLIKQEAENIAAIIKNLFTSNNPLNTNLQVSLIKNSDLDLTSSFAEFGTSNKADAAYGYGLLHSIGELEYVMDARIKDNIYTMNYGSGDLFTLLDLDTTPQKFMPFSGLNMQAYIHDRAEIGHGAESSDIFGLKQQKARRQNKNHFHSLPMNYYHNTTTSDKMTDQTWGFWTSPGDLIDRQTLWKDHLTTWAGIPVSKIVGQQRLTLGFADAFSKELNPEVIYGNNLNAALGNVTFQPFVHVIDYGIGEDRDFSLDIVVGDIAVDDLCSTGTEIIHYDINDHLEQIEDLYEYRLQENNDFNCHMYAPGDDRGIYVPLGAWSYFYNNIFMEGVESSPDLKEIYNKFGLKPFFKEISFGMRMNYSTAAPEILSSNIPGSGGSINEISEFIKEAFNATAADTKLKNVKSLLGQRPYIVAFDGDEAQGPELSGRPTTELQIPIVEIKREIKSHDDIQSISVGEGDIYPISSFGAAPPAGVSGMGSMSIDHATLLANDASKAYARHLIDNPHQFFYKNVADELLQEIKNSAEFKLMFDYLFPMKRYMALATIVASDGLSRFIPEPTTVLEKTKMSLQTIIENINNSADYKQVPTSVANMMGDLAMRSEAGTSGKEPDMTKEILKILYRTPLLILKGFVEVTDPAIIIAKRIIDISNAIQQATIAAAKQALQAAKQVSQAGIDGANMIMLQAKMNIKMGIGFAKTSVAMLPSIIVDGEPKAMSDYVTMDDSDDYPGNWIFTAVLPDEVLAELEDDQKAQWDDFVKEFEKLKDLSKEFADAGKLAWPGSPLPQPGWEVDFYDNKEVPVSPGELVLQKRGIEREIEVVIRKAENTMKDLFSSPYLLPGMWAAMLPTWIPFGGGMPPVNPWFVTGFGPPSTIPGMIYLALLFIDAMEEKMHDDQQKLSAEDPNCEEQL